MSTKETKGMSDVGRLHEIRAELESKRRGPYVLTADIVIPEMTRGQAKKMRLAKNEDEQLDIMLGDQREAIEALYDERPLTEWVAFQRDLQEHYYGAGVTGLPGGSQGS
ncbi:hypothetical protein GS982_20330 [Rhodococcus hoagii]|nr:hypothetical protein [Prescottella equi]